MHAGVYTRHGHNNYIVYEQLQVQLQEPCYRREDRAMPL